MITSNLQDGRLKREVLEGVQKSALPDSTMMMLEYLSLVTKARKPDVSERWMISCLMYHFLPIQSGIGVLRSSQYLHSHQRVGTSEDAKDTVTDRGDIENEVLDELEAMKSSSTDHTAPYSFVRLDIPCGRHPSAPANFPIEYILPIF